MAERLEQIFLHYGVSMFALIPFLVMCVVTFRARRVASEVRERELRDETAFHEVYEADLTARRHGIVTGMLGAVAILVFAMTLAFPASRSIGEGGGSAPTLTSRPGARTHTPARR